MSVFIHLMLDSHRPGKTRNPRYESFLSSSECRDAAQQLAAADPAGVRKVGA